MDGGDRIAGLLLCICLFAMNVALVLACPRFSTCLDGRANVTQKLPFG